VVEGLLLHIGTHKTGTTAIQGALGDAYDDLVGEGILYPRAGRTPGPGHANLCLDFLGDSRYTPSHGGVAELLSEVRTIAPRHVVISSEVFVTSPALTDLGAELAAEMAADDLRVLAYVRPQWERLESAYAGRVKMGRTHSSFVDFLESHIGDHEFDYSRQLRPWLEAFGDRLTVRRYEPSRFGGGDVVTDFSRAVDVLPHIPPQTVRRVNTRPGVRTIEILRSIRAFLVDRQLDGVGPLGPVFWKHHNRLERIFSGDARFRALTPELASRIDRYFRHSNREFADEFLGENGDLFPPVGSVESPTLWTLEAASRSERRLYAETLVSMVSQIERLPGLEPDVRGRAKTALAEARRCLESTVRGGKAFQALTWRRLQRRKDQSRSPGS
jgi:hypothetical protein